VEGSHFVFHGMTCCVQSRISSDLSDVQGQAAVNLLLTSKLNRGILEVLQEYQRDNLVDYAKNVVYIAYPDFWQ
jgi:hypothetical protein